jgi:histidine triad (HIT) family protein
VAAECVFCGIAGGRIAVPVVMEDALAIAVLDHRPLFPGHCLLIPKAHYETLLDVPEDVIGPLFARARRLSAALELGLGAEGSFVALNNRVSQSVPHLHIHVVPRRRGDGLKGFFWPRGKYRDAAHAEEVRAAIAQALERFGQPSP